MRLPKVKLAITLEVQLKGNQQISAATLRRLIGHELVEDRGESDFVCDITFALSSAVTDMLDSVGLDADGVGVDIEVLAR